MSLFSKLFGGGGGSASAEVQPEEYEGFAIYPEPQREGNKWRLAARVEKEVGGEIKTHQLIRADMLDDEETAISVSVAKARQVIDEQGERLFR